eukprot:scaffold113823_cov23-Tisochrysis_lutea.AAC.1
MPRPACLRHSCSAPFTLLPATHPLAMTPNTYSGTAAPSQLWCSCACQPAQMPPLSRLTQETEAPHQ